MYVYYKYILYYMQYWKEENDCELGIINYHFISI